ncbi:MAG: transglutaminase-like domain-containing protein [Phycisphaerales bacterium]
MNASSDHPTRRLRIAVIGVAAAFTLAACGAAQVVVPRDKDKDKKKPAPTAPAKPGPGGTTPALAPSAEPLTDRLLKLTNSRDWTVDAELNISAGYRYEAQDRAITPVPNSFSFNSAAVVFPLVPESAASKIERDLNKAERVTGQLLFNDKPHDTEPQFLGGYAAGARLARFELRNVVGNEATLKLKIRMTCWETTYDDKLAETIPWPSRFPAVAQSTFKPQLFVDLEDPKDERLKNLVEQWLEKKDAKSIPPSRLARILANKAVEYIQPSGDGLTFNRNGSFAGFRLEGTLGILNNRGRGSEHDIACFLCAVYRAAGLPARTIVGYDRYDDKKGDNIYDRGKGGGQKLRSWVEFCLVDPEENTEIWIPVDIVRMRKASSRARAVDMPQKYFGTNDELSYIQPIAFQYHPPTTVTARAPAFWGWLTNPTTDVFEQWIKFQSARTANSTENPYNRNKKKDDDKKK